MATYPVTAVAEVTSIRGQSRDSYTNRFKIHFLAEWDKHVHTKTTITKHIAKEKGTMGGFESLGSIVTGLPQSAGIASFENDNLARPTVGTYSNPVLHARQVHTRLAWTGQVERSARGGDKMAWASPRKQDLKGADEQMRLNIARMMYLGPYQPLATVLSQTAGTPWTTVLYARNARRSDTDNLWKFGAHYLRVGMDIDHVPASGGAVDVDGAADRRGQTNEETSPLTIATIDKSDATAPSITVNDPAVLNNDMADESIIIPRNSRKGAAGSVDVTDYSGFNGLMQMASNSDIYTALYDLTRTGTSNPTLNGVRINNSGTPRAYSEDYLALAVDRIADEGRGEEPNLLLMDRSVRREHVKESKGDRRFKEVQTEKGFGKLVFHAGSSLIPVEVDRDCPPGLVFVLATGGFGWLTRQKMTTLPERFVADKDETEMVILKEGNVFTEAPFNNGVIEDITFDLTDVT